MLRKFAEIFPKPTESDISFLTKRGAMANRDIIFQHFIKQGKAILKEPKKEIAFLPDKAENKILNNLKDYPHMFVLGFLMDKGLVSQRAWEIPFLIKDHLEFPSFDFIHFTEADHEQMILHFQDEGLHRYPLKMGRVFSSAIRHLEEEYGGDAAKIWKGKPKSATLIKRFVRFEGLDVNAATHAANMLYKDFKIPLEDTSSLDVTPDPAIRRVLRRSGFVGREARHPEIQFAAREMHPNYPAIFALACHDIGDRFCLGSHPKCDECELHNYCPKYT